MHENLSILFDKKFKTFHNISVSIKEKIYDTWRNKKSLGGSLGRYLWKILQAVGGYNNFLAVLNEPILLNWATEQIEADEKDKFELIKHIFEALKPWLSPELFQAEQKHINAEKSKKSMLASLLHTSTDKVTYVNNFEKKLAKYGISKEEIDKIVGKK